MNWLRRHFPTLFRWPEPPPMVCVAQTVLSSVRRLQDE